MGTFAPSELPTAAEPRAQELSWLFPSRKCVLPTRSALSALSPWQFCLPSSREAPAKRQRRQRQPALLLEGIFLAWRGVARGSLFFQTVVPWSVTASTGNLRLREPREQPSEEGMAAAASQRIPSRGSRWIQTCPPGSGLGTFKTRKSIRAENESKGKCEENPVGVRRACHERSPTRITPREGANAPGLLLRVSWGCWAMLPLLPELPGNPSLGSVSTGEQGHAPTLPSGWHFPGDPPGE